MDTEALAKKLGVTPQAVRARLSAVGHCYYVRPTKLPKRRWWWPHDSFERLVRDGARRRERVEQAA